jgi:hypothetical protein
MVAIHYLGVALIALSAILLARTALDALRRRAVLRDPVRVNGEVIRVRHVEPASSDSSTTPPSGKFYPTVRYKAEDGRQLEKELVPSNDPGKWKVGQVIRLVYQRGKPSNVVDRELGWADLVATTVGSLFILAVGVAMCLTEPSSPTDPH